MANQDPEQIDRRTERIFYDGECGVCHWAVDFVARRDPGGATFRFAPLGGETFTAELAPEQRTDLPDSLVVQNRNGEVLVRSGGALYILRRLGGVWRLLAVLLGWVPRPLRDWGYDRFAAVRHHFAQRPDGVCPLVPPELGRRFDP